MATRQTPTRNYIQPAFENALQAATVRRDLRCLLNAPPVRSTLRSAAPSWMRVSPALVGPLAGRALSVQPCARLALTRTNLASHSVSNVPVAIHVSVTDLWRWRRRRAPTVNISKTDSLPSTRTLRAPWRLVATSARLAMRATVSDGSAAETAAIPRKLGSLLAPRALPAAI